MKIGEDVSLPKGAGRTIALAWIDADLDARERDLSRLDILLAQPKEQKLDDLVQITAFILHAQEVQKKLQHTLSIEYGGEVGISRGELVL